MAPADGEHGHNRHHHHHEPPRGFGARLRAMLGQHSHDTADTIATALTTSDEGVRALKVSLVGLGVTAAIELVVVIVSGSVALLSDTVHNFADALTALPLGVAFWLGRRPPNPRYTYGYGRAEDLAGISIVVVMAASSVLAAWEAALRLAHPRPISAVGAVVAAGVVGFVGNEAVALYRTRVGRHIGSAALVADGRHARTDGLTSLAVVVGAVGAAAGWKQADPIVGLVITLAILLVLRNAARDIYRRLMDSVDPELVTDAAEILVGSPGVRGVGRVRLRWVGHELLADADIVADATLTLAEAHSVAEQAHHELLHRLPRLAHATIHVDPAIGVDAPGGIPPRAGADPHAVTAHHFPAAPERPEG